MIERADAHVHALYFTLLAFLTGTQCLHLYRERKRGNKSREPIHLERERERESLYSIVLVQNCKY